MSRLVTRRAFLRTSALAAAATVVGCRAAPAPTPTAQGTDGVAATQVPATVAPVETPQAQPSPTSEIKRGGVLRFGEVVSDFAYLDPVGAFNVSDWWVVMNLLFNGPYDYDADYNLVPELAADRPKISDDAMVYTIPFRKDVRFHNGRLMTAHDVKFAFERSFWPATQSWLKGYTWFVEGLDEVREGKATEVSGLRVLDDFTLEVRLTQPQATFLQMFTYPCWCAIPKQEVLDAGEDWGSKVVIGTGPFRFVSAEPAQKMVLERNPDYFKPGLPYLDGVEIRLQLPGAVAVLMWEQGELDVTQFPAEDLERLLSDPKYEPAVQGPTSGLNIVRLSIHTKTKPFDDVRVRQAIAMAIDKEALIRQYAGRGWTYEGFYAKGMWQFDPNFKSKWQYNPQRAKELLAEAGFPNGTPEVLMAAYPGPVTEMVQADLRAVGINVVIAQSQQATYEAQISGEVPLAIYGWGDSITDAYAFVGAWITCASSQVSDPVNTAMYCNPRIDELLAKAEALPPLSPERLAIYREIDDFVINQDVATVGLYNESNFLLYQDYVRNAPYSATYYHPYLEEAWLDK